MTSRLYLPTVLPDDDGWTRFDDAAESSELADVYLEDDLLVIDAFGTRTALFQRREDVLGLAPAYRLEMEVSQALGVYHGGWLKLGGYIGALFQDRLLLLFARPVGDEEVQLGIPVDPGDGSPYLSTIHLANIELGVFHSISVTAEREGWIQVEVDGTVVGGVDWDQLPLTSHEAVQDLGDVLEHEEEEAGVFFGAIGFQFTTRHSSSTSERQAWLLARRGEDRTRSVPQYVSTGPQPQRRQKPGSALGPVITVDGQPSARAASGGASPTRSACLPSTRTSRSR